MLKKYFSLCKKIKKKTLHVQRKMFEITASGETDNNMFALVLDQSLVNCTTNKNIPYESLKLNQSKGW